MDDRGRRLQKKRMAFLQFCKEQLSIIRKSGSLNRHNDDDDEDFEGDNGPSAEDNDPYSERELHFQRESSVDQYLNKLKDWNQKFINNTDVKGHMSVFQRKVAKEKERAKLKVIINIQKAQMRWYSHEMIRAREKFSFCLGVGNLVTFAFFLGYAPQLIPSLYTLEMALFMPLRYTTYHKKGYQYFIADLCYWINLLLLLWVWILPTSGYLFVSVFFLSFGSLTWAIVAWRNSLVFHSLDKVTSVFIHFAPPLVLFVITHVLPDSYVQERYPGAHRDSVKLISALLVSCITYTIWQILYYYFIQVRKRDKIAAGRPTSFTWLRRSYAKTWLGRMVLRFPEKSQPYCYMTIQFLYTLVTMAPCPIWLKSRMCCGLFLVFVFSCSIWNGASYYFDVLGMKMQNEINRIETQTHDEDSSESGRNSPDSQKFLSADDLQSLKKKN